MSAVVGIDLGTTNTVVAVVEGGKAQALGDDAGERLIPSVVSFHPSGQVIVGGKDISHASPSELTEVRRSTVGLVFQSVNLVPFLTARENLLLVDELRGSRGKQSKERADRLLAAARTGIA